MHDERLRAVRVRRDGSEHLPIALVRINQLQPIGSYHEPLESLYALVVVGLRPMVWRACKPTSVLARSFEAIAAR